MRLPVVSVVLGLLVGCQEPLSNAVLREDAAFLAALPGSNGHLAPVESLSAATAREVPLPLLLDLAARYGRTANGHIERLLGAVDSVRATPPSARTTDTRRWGPLQQDSGLWLRLDMSRSGAAFSYELSRSSDPTGSWVPFLTGDHVAGETVQEGLGSYAYTLGLLPGQRQATGSMLAEYDFRDPDSEAVLVELVDVENTGEFEDSVFWWQILPDGELRFEYLAQTDVDADEEDERLEVVVRLQEDRSGRGDALVTHVEDSAVLYRVEQCWDSALDEVYLGSTGGGSETRGDPAACAYPNSARTENL